VLLAVRFDLARRRRGRSLNDRDAIDAVDASGGAAKRSTSRARSQPALFDAAAMAVAPPPPTEASSVIKEPTMDTANADNGQIPAHIAELRSLRGPIAAARDACDRSLRASEVELLLAGLPYEVSLDELIATQRHAGDVIVGWRVRWSSLDDAHAITVERVRLDPDGLDGGEIIAGPMQLDRAPPHVRAAAHSVLPALFAAVVARAEPFVRATPPLG
jgi:hypothetical protein